MRTSLLSLLAVAAISAGLSAQQQTQATTGAVFGPQAPPGTYTYFGAGCKGSNGKVPTMANTGVPEINKSWTVSCTNLGATAITGLITGASNTKWGPGKLPASLTGLGAPGCNLYVSMDAIIGIVGNSSGVASLTGTLPNSTSLIGVKFYQQFLVLDSSANTLGITWSNGATGLVGG